MKRQQQLWIHQTLIEVIFFKCTAKLCVVEKRLQRSVFGPNGEITKPESLEETNTSPETVDHFRAFGTNGTEWGPVFVPLGLSDSVTYRFCQRLGLS